MSSISSVGQGSAAQLLSTSQSGQSQRAPDGDTPAQEAAESSATQQAEQINGGYAPHSSGAVNKLV